MKYTVIILILLFFAVIGCVDSSEKEVLPSQLLSNPAAFEGKTVCVSGILNNNSISGIPLGKNQVISEEEKNGTLAKVCGKYDAGKLEVSSINPVLTISTEKYVYRSNETLEARVVFISPDDGRGQVQVSGIKNAFDRALIDETREASFKKGLNQFNFEFKTPSCEECSALEPGIYPLNVTVTFDGRIFETYREIEIERETK